MIGGHWPGGEVVEGDQPGGWTRWLDQVGWTSQVIGGHWPGGEVVEGDPDPSELDRRAELRVRGGHLLQTDANIFFAAHACSTIIPTLIYHRSN